MTYFVHSPPLLKDISSNLLWNFVAPLLISNRQVYLEFASAAASTALKHYMDNLKPTASDPKLPTASYNMSHVNPYKTLPKDVQSRRETRGTSESTRGYSGGGQSFGDRGNFRGRGNFGGGNRGGMNMGGGGGFQRGGGAYQGGMGNMGGMPNMGGANMGMAGFGNMAGGFNNFNRGGMMGGGMRGGMAPRGGRGGMGGPGMMGPMAGMGGMNMGNMPMGGMNAMGMGGSMMGMGGKSINGNPELPLPSHAIDGGGPLTPQTGGFQNQTHFNPAFFQGQNTGGDWSNPHGAKRPRAE